MGVNAASVVWSSGLQLLQVRTTARRHYILTHIIHADIKLFRLKCCLSRIKHSVDV